MNNYLLKYCLYYKGEKECPKVDKNSLFWWYEFDWIERMSKDNSDISDMLEYYIRAGLSTFQMFDNTPITLKALLFNRYSHWTMGDIDGFKEWYLTGYRNDAQEPWARFPYRNIDRLQKRRSATMSTIFTQKY